MGNESVTPPEELLPKPLTDLPLPEKQIPAHLASQGDALQGYVSQKKTKWLILFLVLATLILVGIAGGKYYIDQQKLKAINDFESCAAAGNPIQESYPAVCRTSDGISFTQVLSEEEQKNLLPPEDQSANWETSNSVSNLNWKIYSNKKLGYGFEIPSDWVNTGYVGDTGNPLITFNSPDYEEMESERPKGGSISVLRYPTEETDVKKEYIKPHGGGEYTDLSYLKVDGVNAIRYNVNWEGAATVTSFIKDGYLYEITIGNLNGPLTPYLDTYNKIVTSFKFIDLTLSCTPRPSCLDATPACKIPETEDMCPPSPTPFN